MLTSVSIRRAGPGDEAILTTFSERVCPALLSHDWSFALDEKNHFIDLAEDDQLFAFVCGGQPEHADVLPDGTGEIFVCLVDTHHRRQGIGRKLMIRAVTVLKRRGFVGAFMWLPASHDWLIDWATEIGFVASDYERTGAALQPERGFLLDLDLLF